MKRHRARRALAAAVLALALAVGGGELRAASAVPPAIDMMPAAEVPYAEDHATECVLGGPVVALSVLAYIERAAAAALRGDADDVAVPVLATGFAFGCGTGEVLAPGLWWMYRYL